MRAVVQIQNMVKTFGARRVLEGFSLSVEAGEMVAIRGRSGSGKSTLLNIIGLLEPFDSGSYLLFGERSVAPGSSRAQKIIRERVNYVFQSFALVESRTVQDNLMLAMRYIKESESRKIATIEEALRQVGLAGCKDQRVLELSGGEQQRVALARCMIKPGRLVLADEPTGSLDEANRKNVMSILERLHESGRTLIIVTHDQEVVNRCERVVDLGCQQTRGKD